jgi:membrane protease YdiL (CAAX protease family)
MKKAARIFEFVILFILFPLLFVLDILNIRFAIPILLAFGIWALIILLHDRQFDRKQLWKAGALKQRLKTILIIYAVTAIVGGIFIYIFAPQNLFNFPRQAPGIWVMVMLLYPIFSVYPQELIYRTFFFHRYRDIFPSGTIMILVNALAFGYMHIIFENALAVVLTVFGGFLFACTYHRTKSTFSVVVEHALYGCYIWTIGLGQYFYHGAVQ